MEVLWFGLILLVYLSSQPTWGIFLQFFFNLAHPCYILCFFSLKACMEDEFLCKSGECLDAKYQCDRVTNCEDGSDEVDCCKL